MARVLKTDVYWGGRRWRAGTTPPPGIAKKITNPAAWIEVPDDGAPVAPPAPTPPAPEVVQPVPEQPNSGPGADTVIGEVVVEPAPLPVPQGTDAGVATPADPGSPGVVQQLRPPPRSGRGSGLPEWQAFARTHHVDVPTGADRSDIIAACEDAGLLDDDA